MIENLNVFPSIFNTAFAKAKRC